MPTKKIINQRTCLVTRQKLNKNQLIRLVKINDYLIIDKEQNKQGRGYYISKQPNILKIPNLAKILSNRTKTKNNDKIIEQLKEIIK